MPSLLVVGVKGELMTTVSSRPFYLNVVWQPKVDFQKCLLFRPIQLWQSGEGDHIVPRFLIPVYGGVLELTYRFMRASC